MLWQGISNVDSAMLDAALRLDRGTVTQSPVKLTNAYCLIQAISTYNNHPGTEDSAFATAIANYKAQQAPLFEPAAVINLVKKSKVVYYIHA